MDTFGNFGREANEVIKQIGIVMSKREEITLPDAVQRIKVILGAKLVYLTGKQLLC